MSRKVMFIAGFAVLAAGAAGWAAGTLSAPVSGREMRRRLAWRAEERWRTMSSASERMLRRAAARAATEIAHRITAKSTAKA